MDLVELALNPRKAAQRFSPFTRELPEHVSRKLEYVFGDLTSSDPGERALYSRDAAVVPAALGMLLKRDAWAVVRARIRGDLVEVLKFANQNGVPIVPRGGGTSAFGSSVPTEGGVVVDMREFDRVLHVDEKSMTVRCEGGVTFADLEKRLAAKGLALRQYPPTYYGSTVAGWLAVGGGGIGSAKYGPFLEDLVEVEIMQPDGAIARVDGEDLGLVWGAHGVTGFILEVTLRVRKATPVVPYIATFPDLDQAAHALKRVAREVGAYHVAIHDPDYVETTNAAAGRNVFPKGGWSILVGIEESDGTLPVETLKGIVQSSGGKLASEKDAATAWAARTDYRTVQRLGPSVVTAHVVFPNDRFRDAYSAARDVARMGRHSFHAYAVSPTEMVLVYFGLEDERRTTFPAATGNTPAILDAVKEHAGGRGYSSGVMGVGDARAILGKDRVKEIKKFRKLTDPKDVFNPGPVVGGRSRFMPLPVRDLGMQLALAGPFLKSQRGMFEYRGGDKADPSTLAVSHAIGRVNAGPVADVAYDVTTCTMCAACNHVAPERPGAHLESGLPRGRVQLAKAILEGKAAPSRETQRRASLNPLSHEVDAICPVAIPINRVTDLLLGTFVDALGPLPEHAELAESAETEWNVLGKPKDARTKWAALSWSTDARTLFFADDVASYEAPEIAVGAANAVMNAGVPLQYLAKLERTSGATLVETGQRDAAKAHAVAMMEEMQKRNVDSVISPDANAVRTMKLDWPTWARKADVRAPFALHVSTALAQYVKQKRIEFEDAWGEKVAWHPPAALSADDRSAGRDVLAAMGADLVDVPPQESGFGRALEKTDAALQSAIAEGAVKAYQDAGAKVIVTATPGDYVLLKNTAKKAKAAVEVVDLSAIVAERMKAREGAAAAPVALPQEEEKPKEPEIGPDQFRVEFVKEGVVLAVDKNQTILEAGEEAGMELPSSCRAGSCDTCSAKWEGAAPEQSAGEALSADQQKTYVLTCIAKPKGAVKIWSDERP